MINDLTLIEEYKKGSSAAFEALYKKYASKMKWVAFRYVNDQALAEDILQEAFVKVFKKIETYENTGSFEGWLRRTVVNTAINYYNSIKKENERMAEFGASAENENATESADDGDNYTLQELMDAVNMLPEGYKVVFNLYAIDQYSHKEIAEALNISEGTSKSQLFKARTFLKKILKEKKTIAK
jgi:RNA polymerase sigma-70 factor (ECF subfamily)